MAQKRKMTENATTSLHQSTPYCVVKQDIDCTCLISGKECKQLLACSMEMKQKSNNLTIGRQLHDKMSQVV